MKNEYLKLQRYAGIIVPIILSLFATTHAFADIEHISLNKLNFVEGESVSMRVNLVAEPSDFRELEFVLYQKSGTETLIVRSIGKYLIELIGFDKVVDSDAYLVVHQYRVNKWEPFTQIALFGDGVEVNLAHNPMPEYKGEKHTHSPQISATASRCMIEYQPGETLWRIATRYAKQWDTNVYVAILAIFEANPDAFNRQNINSLKKNATLSCPDITGFDQYSTQSEARHLFEQLSGAGGGID